MLFDELVPQLEGKALKNFWKARVGPHGMDARATYLGRKSKSMTKDGVSVPLDPWRHQIAEEDLLGRRFHGPR